MTVGDGDQPVRIQLPRAPQRTASPAAMEAFVRAFEDLARAIVEAYAPHIRAFSLLAHTIDYSLRPAWHRRFCTRCRPRRASRPLAIDGHAYRRRQRARRRRARR